MIETIDEKTVRTDLLSGLPVLDAGARGFRFARWFAARGHRVVAMDPDPSIQDPSISGVEFWSYALVGGPAVTDRVSLAMVEDPEARYIGTGGKTESVQAVSLLGVTYANKIERWDVVKLNIEGSEYEILEEWPGPVARQITVSFHEHTPRGRGREGIEKIVAHLQKWYRVESHKWEARYCAGENYWDSRFVLKDLPA